MQSYNTTLPKQNGTASWTSDWFRVGAAGYRVASLTIGWTEVSPSSGAITFEGTDDPDKAVAVLLTVPTFHGTLTVTSSASQGLAVLSNCPGYIRVRYSRISGGGANQFTVAVTLTE